MGQCKQCNREFKVTRKWQNFCSEDCRNVYHNKRRKEERALMHVQAQETHLDADSKEVA